MPTSGRPGMGVSTRMGAAASARARSSVRLLILLTRTFRLTRAPLLGLVEVARLDAEARHRRPVLDFEHLGRDAEAGERLLDDASPAGCRRRRCAPRRSTSRTRRWAAGRERRPSTGGGRRSPAAPRPALTARSHGSGVAVHRAAHALDAGTAQSCRADRCRALAPAHATPPAASRSHCTVAAASQRRPSQRRDAVARIDSPTARCTPTKRHHQHRRPLQRQPGQGPHGARRRSAPRPAARGCRPGATSASATSRQRQPHESQAGNARPGVAPSRAGCRPAASTRPRPPRRPRRPPRRRRTSATASR